MKEKLWKLMLLVKFNMRLVCCPAHILPHLSENIWSLNCISHSWFQKVCGHVQTSYVTTKWRQYSNLNFIWSPTALYRDCLWRCNWTYPVGGVNWNRESKILAIKIAGPYYTIDFNLLAVSVKNWLHKTPWSKESKTLLTL